MIVVTTSHDVGAGFVIEELRRREGVKAFRFNVEDFPTKNSIVIHHDRNGKSDIELTMGNQGTLKGDQIFSVFYRREAEAILDPAIKSSENKLFAKTEVVGALDTTWDILNCFWVNHPRYSTSLMTKVAQTHYAGQVGLNVPNTLVTTSFAEIQSFYKKYNKRVIAKQLGNARGAQDWIKGRMYTQQLDDNNISIFKASKYAPVMLQEAIPKMYELRITVVGNKLFAVKIDSQAKSRTSVDWRKGPIGRIKHEVVELPKEIKRKLIVLHKVLNLAYSGTDMIVTPQGEYYLLELNPNGEYVWTEVLTKTPITKALCDLLIKGGDKYGRGGNPAIRRPIRDLQ